MSILQSKWWLLTSWPSSGQCPLFIGNWISASASWAWMTAWVWTVTNIEADETISSEVNWKQYTTVKSSETTWYVQTWLLGFARVAGDGCSVIRRLICSLSAHTQFVMRFDGGWNPMAPPSIINTNPPTDINTMVFNLPPLQHWLLNHPNPTLGWPSKGVGKGQLHWVNFNPCN